METELLQAVTSGLLLGLIYSLVAVGLTLIWGVMDIVNFAHGDFMMLGMYTSYVLYTYFHLDPLLSIPFAGGLLFLVGVVTYRTIIKRILDAPMLVQIFTTFGLMILLRYIIFFFFKPDYRSIGTTILSGNIKFLGVYVGIPEAVAAFGAFLTTGIIYWIINHTKVGGAITATSENRDAAQLMGINPDRIFSLSWGIGAAAAGIAGALLSNFFYIFPEVGGVFGLTAFVVVCFGGFGNIHGAFFAGLIVGLIESLGGYVAPPEYKHLFVFSLFIFVLWLRPRGLLGVT
jgi:branched-chain amino acid transport system permease protein